MQPDPLAPWRELPDDEPLSLRAVAALCVPFAPTRRFPTLQTQITSSDREMIATRDGWLNRLADAAEKGQLEATRGTRPVQVPMRGTRSSFDDGWRAEFSSPTTRTEHRPSWPDGTTTAGAVRAWVATLPAAMRPPLFCGGRLSTPPAQDAAGGDGLDPRERASMLRIIRALSEMAKLPPRGAATAVEAELQRLGFAGPKEAAIRKILNAARDAEPDEAQ